MSRIGSLATSLGARRVAQKAFEYTLEKNVRIIVLPDVEAIRACRRFADEDRYLVELACSVCPALCYNGKLIELVPGFIENTVLVIVVWRKQHIIRDDGKVFDQPKLKRK